MQLLVHIGFNKCASSYIQHALARSRGELRQNGVHYPLESKHAAHYGVSRHYGFGPEAKGVAPRSLHRVIADARNADCQRIILSSEYFSLGQPQAVARFLADLHAAGADARLLVFSRETVPWLRSLFNQYVKTVDGGPFYDSIDAYVTHVLKSGAIDLARRYRAWSDAIGPKRMTHVPIAEDQPKSRVLAPFKAFADLPIAPPEGPVNHSMPAGALYLTGRLRQAHRGPLRERLLGRIAAGDCDWAQAPEDYLRIAPKNLSRLFREVAEPFARAVAQDPVPGRTAWSQTGSD